MSYPHKVYTVVLSVLISCEIAVTQDSSICNFTKIHAPPPPPKLNPSYSTTIEWKNVNNNSTMIVKEYFDGIKNRGSQDIYMDQHYTKILYDVRESQFVQYTKDDGCTVKDMGSYTFYEDKFWISAFNELYGVTSRSEPGFQATTTVRNMTVNHWQTCLYFLESKITAHVDFYFTKNWEMAHASPQSFVPVRFEIIGSIIKSADDGGRMPFHVIGDFVDFNSAPDLAELQTHMQLPAGVYCYGKKSRKPLNPLTTEFSVLFEIVDNLKQSITYEHVWYNNAKKLIRRDSKKSDNTDPDSTMEIFDFSLGVHYSMDPMAGTCAPADLLHIGDKYVSDNGNGTIRMMSVIEFFHMKTSLIQYVGYRTTRGILCDVWVGTYVDHGTNTNTTVEWYFNKKYSEAVGGVISYSSLVRMDIWEDESKEPLVRNVLQMDNEAPTQDVYSVGLCYKTQRIRVIVHLKVVNGTIGILSDSYLKDTLHVKLLGLAELPPLRMADVMLSHVGTTDLYLDGSLLEKAPYTSDNIVPKPQKQHALVTAYNFLEVTLSHRPLVVISNVTHPPVVVQVLGITKLDYAAEFNKNPNTPSTPIRTPPTPELIPTTIKPETPTTYATPDIASPSSPTPLTSRNTQPTFNCSCPTPSCPTTAPVNCPTPQSATKCVCPIVTCPNSPTRQCPTPAPCPVVGSCPTLRPCTPKACPPNVVCKPCPPCAGVTPKCPTPSPSTSSSTNTAPSSTNKVGPEQQRQTGSISSGGAAGLAIGMVVVGVLLGVVLLRVIQRLLKRKDSEERNFFTKYLADDANY